MTDKTGYLAIATYRHENGTSDDMTLAFEPTEDAARNAAWRTVDEQRLDLPDAVTVHAAKEVGYNDRWGYMDEDVIFTDRRIGAWVKPDATAE